MQSYKILVVDDTKDVRKTLVGVLADNDEYLVTAAKDQKDALKKTDHQYFHFIIVDIRLEGDDDEDDSGVKLTEKIRKKNIDSQIIFITGKGMKGQHYKPAKEYNVLAYIEKNVGWVEEICNIIQSEKGNIKNTSFDVFLCHNSKDKDAVKIIAEKLKKNGIKPWLDEWELQPGQPWKSAIQEEIENIASAAVFVGESGFGPWQNAEMDAFLNEFVDRKCPVIPVILGNATAPPTLPPFLKRMTWVDFRKDTPAPMKQLCWGITGDKNRC